MPVIRHSLQGLAVAVGFAALAAVLPSSTGAAEQVAARTTEAAELSALKALFARPDAIPFPEDNPYSEAKARLGEMLFFDPRLSGSNLLSCGSCHNPSLGWEDGQPTATGQGMEVLGRHTPTILNLAWSEVFFWDGRADTLEEQALGPIEAPGEMSQSLDTLIPELEAVPGYQAEFERAFPGQGITADTIAAAIATYERTIVSNLAPFDRWVRGDETAISEEAQRGFVLFNNKANCTACHSGWNMTDDSFHDIGLASTDPGREEVLGIAELRHAFKTPGLRNIDQRAPYMHDGSIATLREVIDHYADGFINRPTLSEDIKPLELSDQERDDLVAFMLSLTSADDPVTLPILPN